MCLNKHKPGISLANSFLSFCPAWINEFNALRRQHQRHMMITIEGSQELFASAVECA